MKYGAAWPNETASSRGCANLIAKDYVRVEGGDGEVPVTGREVLVYHVIKLPYTTYVGNFILI